MKTIVLFVALFAGTTLTTFAQEGTIGINLGVEGALPIGHWSEGAGIGIGGSMKGLYSLSDDDQITFTVGYNKFDGKENTSDVDVSMRFIPLLAGYRHTFSSIYIEPQFGLSIVKSNTFWDEEYGFDDTSSSSTNFSFAIGGGYKMGALDWGIRYQSISARGSLGFIALRVAYGFSL